MRSRYSRPSIGPLSVIRSFLINPLFFLQCAQLHKSQSAPLRIAMHIKVILYYALAHVCHVVSSTCVSRACLPTLLKKNATLNTPAYASYIIMTVLYSRCTLYFRESPILILPFQVVTPSSVPCQNTPPHAFLHKPCHHSGTFFFIFLWTATPSVQRLSGRVPSHFFIFPYPFFNIVF